MSEKSFDPETWLKEYGDYLFRYALVRLRDTTIAEDVLQETFLAALKGREQFRGQAAVKTWLVGILKHKIVDYFRKNSREFSVTNLLSPDDSSEKIFDAHGKWKEEPGAWRDDPAGLLEKKEFWKAFKECLAELPRRLADLFSLREFEGLKTEEICNLLDISTTNLNVQLYRARLRLARCLDVNWFERKKESQE